MQPRALGLLLLLALALLLPAWRGGAAAAPMRIGIEFVLLDDSSHLQYVADELDGIGATAAKPYPRHIEWGAMQRAPGARIDFSRLDRFVRTFEAHGYTDFTLCLRSESPWASRRPGGGAGGDPTPKPQYMAAYERWVAAVVERYDGDGMDDMPGLKSPIRVVEIGSEFSVEEPEPVAEYLVLLHHAYEAAHRASPQVRVAHAAFLATNAFQDDPGPEALEAAFARVDRRILHHSLDDMRRVLDHPECFDLVNAHSFGGEAEIPPLCRWLRREMQQRNYSRPILLSDAAPWPFIAWGPASECDRADSSMGVLVSPAAGADRCRLARYFGQLLAGNPKTLNWTQRTTAVDIVKRAIVAASEGVAGINLANVEDLPWLKLPSLRAGAGAAAWSGFVDPVNRLKRAGWFAARQLLTQMGGCDSVVRVPQADPALRLYEIHRPDRTCRVIWLDPGRVLLPGEPWPSQRVTLKVGTPSCVVESADTGPAFLSQTANPVPTVSGTITVTVTPAPTYVYGVAPRGKP